MVSARTMLGLVAAVLLLGALACSVSVDLGGGRLRQRHHLPEEQPPGAGDRRVRGCRGPV